MSTYWPIILTGTLGIIGTLAGTISGVLTGRRGATDQAHVEHRQWLRGQRQQAYTAFIGMWDEIFQELVNLQTSWDSRVHEWQQAGDEDWTPGNLAEEILTRVGRRFRQHKEQVELLGPKAVDKALKELEEALLGMREVIWSQSVRRQGDPWVDQPRWGAAMTRAVRARRGFHAQAIRVIRTPPGPQGEEE